MIILLVHITLIMSYIIKRKKGFITGRYNGKYGVISIIGIIQGRCLAKLEDCSLNILLSQLLDNKFEVYLFNTFKELTDWLNL